VDEITAILVDLFIIFARARVAGELFARLRQPSIVPEVRVVWLDRDREEPNGPKYLVAEP
jgi:hypothetical protein